MGFEADVADQARDHGVGCVHHEDGHAGLLRDLGSQHVVATGHRHDQVGAILDQRPDARRDIVIAKPVRHDDLGSDGCSGRFGRHEPLLVPAIVRGDRRRRVADLLDIRLGCRRARHRQGQHPCSEDRTHPGAHSPITHCLTSCFGASAGSRRGARREPMSRKPRLPAFPEPTTSCDVLGGGASERQHHRLSGSGWRSVRSVDRSLTRTLASSPDG